MPTENEIDAFFARVSATPFFARIEPAATIGAGANAAASLSLNDCFLVFDIAAASRAAIAEFRVQLTGPADQPFMQSDSPVDARSAFSTADAHRPLVSPWYIKNSDSITATFFNDTGANVFPSLTLIGIRGEPMEIAKMRGFMRRFFQNPEGVQLPGSQTGMPRADASAPGPAAR